MKIKFVDLRSGNPVDSVIEDVIKVNVHYNNIYYWLKASPDKMYRIKLYYLANIRILNDD